MKKERNYIDYVKEEIINRLNELKNETIDIYELTYLLVEGKVSDGTWTHNAYEAKELVKAYWDVCSEFCYYYQKNCGAPAVNPITNPELFLCQMMQEATENLMEQCDSYIELLENNEEEICLTEKLINILVQEIRQVDSLDFIYD